MLHPAFRTRPDCGRRLFLRRLLATPLLPAVLSPCFAGQPPEITNPRATDGDERVQPKWDQLLTLTVGNSNGDLNGTSDRVLQAAVDSVARKGGGTVRLLPGTWVLRNSVVLASRVRIVGSGSETLLTRPASASTTLSADSDWYDQEITLQDAKGFEVGDSVCLGCWHPPVLCLIRIHQNSPGDFGQLNRHNAGDLIRSHV